MDDKIVAEAAKQLLNGYDPQQIICSGIVTSIATESPHFDTNVYIDVNIRLLVEDSNVEKVYNKIKASEYNNGKKILLLEDNNG